jgi:hypothetical protein
VTFSDFHVVDEPGPSSIGACSIHPGRLNAAQRALEYMVFNLTSPLGG